MRCRCRCHRYGEVWEMRCRCRYHRYGEIWGGVGYEM